MSERGNRRTLVGTVVSNKMDKTVVVRVERLVQDQRYKKYVRHYSRFMAHDEGNACAEGDQVRIIERSTHRVTASHPWRRPDTRTWPWRTPPSVTCPS